MRPAFIQTGFPRSLTTGTLEALCHGAGFGILQGKRSQEINDRHSSDGYKPNPNGLAELSRPQFVNIMLNGRAHTASGHGVKSPIDLLGCIPPVDGLHYFMTVNTRDPREIIESYHRAFLSDPGLGLERVSRKKALPCPADPIEYSRVIANTVKFVKVRRDVTIEILGFNEIIDNPIGVFTRLRDLGWPIEPEKSASIIDPSLRRVHVSS